MTFFGTYLSGKCKKYYIFSSTCQKRLKPKEKKKNRQYYFFPPFLSYRARTDKVYLKLDTAGVQFPDKMCFRKEKLFHFNKSSWASWWASHIVNISNIYLLTNRRPLE